MQTLLSIVFGLLILSQSFMFMATGAFSEEATHTNLENNVKHHNECVKNSKFAFALGWVFLIAAELVAVAILRGYKL